MLFTMWHNGRGVATLPETERFNGGPLTMYRIFGYVDENRVLL